jgi:hypothetical protein
MGSNQTENSNGIEDVHLSSQPSNSVRGHQYTAESDWQDEPMRQIRVESHGDKNKSQAQADGQNPFARGC